MHFLGTTFHALLAQKQTTMKKIRFIRPTFAAFMSV